MGSSGRVFPIKMKAGEILLSWTKKLKSFENFSLMTKHKLIALDKNRKAVFEGPKGKVSIVPDKIILALGGASWPKTGSDGAWTAVLSELGAKISPLRPMNCGFHIEWSEHFKTKVDRFPLKNVRLISGDHSSNAEAMITDYGIEGGGIYALSGKLRDQIENSERANLTIDLKPNLDLSAIKEKLLKRPSKTSWTNFLRKSLGLNKEHALLLREALTKEQFENSECLAETIKALSLELIKARPIEEAISTSGGVSFDSLDDRLQLKSAPGIYVIGEMLDFEAPTGGYLLQACFSTAYRVSSRI